MVDPYRLDFGHSSHRVGRQTGHVSGRCIVRDKLAGRVKYPWRQDRGVESSERIDITLEEACNDPALAFLLRLERRIVDDEVAGQLLLEADFHGHRSINLKLAPE